TYKAVENGKIVLLANKEVLVCAGELIMNLVSQKKGKIIPVDSEHSALFQCMQEEPLSSIKKMILTASGGPFREYSIEALQKVTVEDALKHPTYRMGIKNTIDSSTLMNKGLEVIEAFFLFGIEQEKIEAVIHPESIVHGLIEYIDGSFLAQLSLPDMRLPIHYALSYPQRKKNMFPTLDFSKTLTLQFFPLDRKKFICFSLALEALRIGKSMPCFMNAVNEVLVERFCRKEISWWDIGIKLEKLMSSHLVENLLNLEAVLEIEEKARRAAWVM
ncbi:MAG: 1-deoxy-D-xylulose-5-phosphate reductoisomerase, partial [Chlamydiota bacterium]